MGGDYRHRLWGAGDFGGFLGVALASTCRRSFGLKGGRAETSASLDSIGERAFGIGRAGVGGVSYRGSGVGWAMNGEWEGRHGAEAWWHDERGVWVDLRPWMAACASVRLECGPADGLVDGLAG